MYLNYKTPVPEHEVVEGRNVIKDADNNVFKL